MAINGASRMIQADSQLKRDSYPEMNSKFKNENGVVKSIKKFPLKNTSKHNHSK